MRKKKIIFVNSKVRYGVFTLIFSTFFFVCGSANAATLQINPSSTTLSPGNIATLSVVLNSEGIAINNAEAKIIFPADLLEVVSISKGSSIFSLWVEEPTYSNISGTINFSGGIPTPGFNGSNGTAISVVVKAKKVGKADLIFSDVAVRANDGLGTDVLRTKTGVTLSIIQAEAPVIIEDQTPEFVPSSIALQVTSPTHPSQESWYKDNSPIFRWKVPAGIDAIQTGIDNNTSGSPRVILGPTVDERMVKDLEDGIWYFKVRARKGGEWGPINTYIVRVDNTIPQNNGVVFLYDDNKKVLNIKVDIVDETSGLDYYEIFINDLSIKKISPEEFVDGFHDLAVESPGDKVVKLVAVDRAGNTAEFSGSFTVTAMPESIPRKVPYTNEQLLITIGTFTIPLLYFIIIILLIIIILVLSAFNLGRIYGRFNNRLKLRTVLVKGDNTKILLLLKKRLEKHLEILQRTRRNRILSREEKEIKEAIEGDLDEVDRAIEEQKAV